MRPLPDEMTVELRALIGRRRQITEMLTAEKNRLSRAPRRVQKRIEAHIRWLQSELERTDEDLDQATLNTNSARSISASTFKKS